MVKKTNKESTITEVEEKIEKSAMTIRKVNNLCKGFIEPESGSLKEYESHFK